MRLERGGGDDQKERGRLGAHRVKSPLLNDGRGAGGWMPERWLKNGDYTLIIQQVAWGKAIPLQLQLPSNARPHLSDEENRASPLENSNRWRGPLPSGPSEPLPSGLATVTKTTALGLTVGRTTADTVFLVLPS
ncbi:hypothetical protein L1987_26680 [Smallanthus sonchifolius]|uniref:Uncharacterized protein n=1 Tax=Smallanthus sonchifolius TaxID=185202 RepID=A0ACB9IA10_9ASTR|nr:hypothetical protein L1987_26680 [Smallanthus sonchifolius]